MLSPLRYPGGKSDFASTAFQIVQSKRFDDHIFVEPFAGSAIVTLALLESGVVSSAVIIEKDLLIYSFWKALFTRTDELIERFLNLPITIQTWQDFKKFLHAKEVCDADVVDLGLAGLFYNRANFSGILTAGPIGGMGQKSSYPIDCRTNKDEIIVRLLTAATFANAIDVRHCDAVQYIRGKRNQKEIFYVDPPYFVKGELLYRHFYRMGDHKKLASALGQQANPWFLSYDVHHVIEYLYEGFNINRLSFRYSAHSPKNHDELLISNFSIDATVLETPIVRPVRQAHAAAIGTFGRAPLATPGACCASENN